MKKWFVVGLLAVPSLAFARPPSEAQNPQQVPDTSSGAVFGQNYDDPRIPEPAGQQAQGVQLDVEDSYKLEGKIASVDPANNEIVLQREENEPSVALTVAKGASIERNGDEVSLNELQPGDEVRARFDLAGDQPFAVEIESEGKN